MRLDIKIAAILTLLVATSHAGGVARLGVKVVDSETGQPIPQIKVYGGFKNYPKAWGIGAKNNSDEEVTDSEGFCQLSGRTEAGHSSCIVRGNEGFYDSGWYSFDYEKRSALKFGRWIPDDVIITARLDRVVNPIPLYVKNAKGEHRPRKQSDYFLDADYHERHKLSATNDLVIIKDKVLSYDFIKGAFLPPYGNGEIADVTFTFNEAFYQWDVIRGGPGVSLYKKFKLDVSVEFPRSGDGLQIVDYYQKAGLKLREAPVFGYSQKMLLWRERPVGERNERTNTDEKRCYAFRIRTKYDASGNIESAYYGKIYGDINIKDVEGVKFLYYLNPTPNDRNLEWDMKNNLCSEPGAINQKEP